MVARWALAGVRDGTRSQAPSRKTPSPVPAAKEEKKESGSDDGKPAGRQIWLISPQGGEAWQLTEHTTDVGGFDWSKDGKQIAFTAAAETSKAGKERKQKYSEYEVFEQDFTQNQLWTVDVAAAEANSSPVKARAITHNPAIDVRGFAWSPDSTRIAFSADSQSFTGIFGRLGYLSCRFSAWKCRAEDRGA